MTQDLTTETAVSERAKLNSFHWETEMAPVEAVWDRVFLCGFHGPAFPELPSCFIASSQLVWTRITLLLWVLCVYKTFTQLPNSTKGDISGRTTFPLFQHKHSHPGRAQKSPLSHKLHLSRMAFSPGKRGNTSPCAFLPRACPRQPALCSVIQLWEGFYFFSLSHSVSLYPFNLQFLTKIIILKKKPNCTNKGMGMPFKNNPIDIYYKQYRN